MLDVQGSSPLPLPFPRGARQYYRRVKFPGEVIEHTGLEGLEADYSPEYLVEPEYIKEQPAVEQPK